MTPTKDQVANIAAGLVPYGPEHPDYPNEPKDWDGGAYLCRDGKRYVMRGYGWAHGIGCWNATADWDRVAYTPASKSSEPVTKSPVIEHGGGG